MLSISSLSRVKRRSGGGGIDCFKKRVKCRKMKRNEVGKTLTKDEKSGAKK